MNGISNDDPEPIYFIGDPDDVDKKPLILNKDNDEEDPTPIFPSDGYNGMNFNGNFNPTSPQLHTPGFSSPVLKSVKEIESDGNSMGVLYQSTVGSVNLDHRETSRNDLGSRLNSPLLTGNTMDSSSIQLDPINLDPGRFSTPFLNSTKDLSSINTDTPPKPTTFNSPFSPFHSSFNYQSVSNQGVYGISIFQPSPVVPSYYTAQPIQPTQSTQSTQSTQPTQPTQPSQSSIFSSSSYKAPPSQSSLDQNEKEQYRKIIPGFVLDCVRRGCEKPVWYHHLSTAKNVRVPVIEASSFTPQSLFAITRDVFMIHGVLEGCTYPIQTLTLSYFVKELGSLYNASFQTMEGTEMKCGLNICNALFELQQWNVCIVLESSSSNYIGSYSHGTTIERVNWVQQLIEFEKKEKVKNQDSQIVVTPNTILFMTPNSLYDSRYVYAISNTIIYCNEGSIRVYYFPINGKVGSENYQNSSQLLATFPLIMFVEVKQGEHIVIPAGQLYIIQAITKATVIISRFLCGYGLKKQITSYRQLYNDNYDESFKWQFWKVNWLATFLYIRSMRIARGVKVDPCCLPDISISPTEKQTIPFLIVALKILHEVYGSKTNCLQEFESFIAEKLGCLGPLDALIELATCCRDNSWNDASHHIQHPDNMSNTSEDTITAVVDISPYPESIDSNEFIDSFVEDASIKQETINEEDNNNTDSWEFRCVCGIVGHNYDDGREMVQCCKCNSWCHCECVHFNVHSNDDFICIWCKQKQS